MTIFKSILLILNKNRGTLILGLIISVGISFLYAGSLNKSTEVDLSNVNIAIFNEDKQLLSNHLEDYLADTIQLTKLDNTQKAKDDALYFSQVDYILTIPQNFSEEIEKGHNPKLDVQIRPGSYSKAMVDTTINHYLNTFSTYQQTLPDANLEELLTMTNETLAVKGDVRLDESYGELLYRNASAAVFNLLAYGLFMSVFTGIATVYLTFNKPEIRKRNLCSPLSSNKLTKMIFASSMVYSVTVLIVFLAYNLIYTRSPFNQHTLLFLANACVFFITMVTFSLMISSLAKNHIIISVVNNTFILGSCFISGIFVPSTFLPDIIVKISMLTPTYWFTSLNRIIAETDQFDQAFYQETLFHFGILICFSLAFLIIDRIRQKETGGLTGKRKKLVPQS